ncbi:MAG: glutamine amidotransferase [Granulosicoccus sp.]|nr:glutamine amidotransferase [Granulosicoccus sp.]
MKPFLILQLRPETVAADDEYAAIIDKGGLSPGDTHRIRLDLQWDLDVLTLENYSGVIVGGGPGCVSDPDSQKSPADKRIETAVLGLMPRITAQDIPFLGCCYGIGILAHHLGATVSKQRYGEPVGAVDCALTDAGRTDSILKGVEERFRAFVGHKEAVQALPAGCEHLVSSEPCPYQMIRYGENVYATQFHPEADAATFEVRINVYRDAGYFPPEDADHLIGLCRAEQVTMPELILKNFVDTYRA